MLSTLLDCGTGMNIGMNGGFGMGAGYWVLSGWSMRSWSKVGQSAGSWSGLTRHSRWARMGWYNHTLGLGNSGRPQVWNSRCSTVLMGCWSGWKFLEMGG